MDGRRRPLYPSATVRLMTTIDPSLDRALSASWLSTRWGVDTVRINVMRRAGELLAVRPAGSDEWRYPSWQFDSGGNVKPDVARVLAAARGQGIDSERLYELLQRRSGMTGAGRLLDELLAGRVEYVLSAVRSA
jgi:hypothetical protein